jgi:PAS domain S-box-containing protein
MHDEEKTKDQLIAELRSMRRSMAELDRLVRELRSERYLEKSEERYRRIFDYAGVGIDLVDKHGKIVEMNQALEKMLGYSVTELREHTFEKITHPEDREISRINLEALIAGEIDSYRIEKRYIRKDGGVVWADLSVCAIRDENGEHRAATGVIVDITEHKKMENELRQDHRRLEESQRIAKIGTWEWNSVTGETYWSDEVYRIFGLQPGSVIPSYELARDLTFSADTQMWEQAIHTALESQSIFQLEYLALRQDGEVIWVRNEGEVARGMDGRATGISGTVQDITERKDMEAQLLQAQKMEAVGTLAGGIAHDFNNVLQAVLGYAEILIGRQKPGSRDVEDLRKIYAAGMRGADLVRNLLTFSRKVKPKMRVMDLNLEVMEIHKLLSRTIPKTIKIVLRSRGYVNDIMADPSQVGQILMNLAVNARDAMPDGGTLTIQTENVLLDEAFCRTHPEVKPGPHVLLTVSDTGHGMDKHTVERIFDPFFSTKDVGKGTGLGLATVYGIVKEHKGYIECSSEPGQGTVFRIYFPAMEREENAQTLEEEAVPPGGTETILFVEDEQPLRDLGKYILTSFGYEILDAANGQGALKIYRNQGERISLVVLDLNMPEMDGEQCLAEIIRLNPKARVLVVTGFLEHVSKGSLVDKNAAGFVSKPYEVKQLLDKVRAILDSD